MLFDKHHVRFTQREEALLIDGIRKIELAHQLTEDDEATLADFHRDFIDRDLDLRRTTWKRISLMFKAHGIKVPVDEEPQHRWHATRKAYYMTVGGSGSYYPLFGEKEPPEVRIARRQKKRLRAWEKAEKYNNMGNMPMNTDDGDLKKELEAVRKAAAYLNKKVEDLERRAGVPVKAEVIKISDYLFGGNSK